MVQSFGKQLIQRKNFIAQVYLILAIQLVITFVVAKFLRENQGVYYIAMKFFIPLLILPFIIIFLFPLCPPRLKFVLFCTFSFIFGILSLGASQYISKDIIELALVSTIGIFIGMTLIGFGIASIGIDISFIGFILLTALWGLVIVRIALLFLPVNSKTYANIATFSIILFSIFISFDTNRMLNKNNGLDTLDTAMSFYLDIENLFSNLIELGFNGR